jgi:sulfoquinovose isomerase
MSLIDDEEIGDIDQQNLTKYGEKFLFAQAQSLLRFAEGSIIPNGGFGYMDAKGRVDSDKPRESVLQARMIQAFSLGDLLGIRPSKNEVRHGLDALENLFRDKEHGGFFNSIDSRGRPISLSKIAYDHVFIMLAANSARIVGNENSKSIFEYCDSIIDTYFWDDEYQMLRHDWDLKFIRLSNYRGINPNLHAVEAFSAAYDVTQNRKFHARAMGITRNAIHRFGKDNHWLLPEHFDSKWRIVKEFNSDSRFDKAFPYGVCIGHLFEWSRLILQLQYQLLEKEPDYEWLLDDARALYKVGKQFGWEADGLPGFVHTIDWDTKPINSSRMRWVATEAVMAAYTLWKITDEIQYLKDYDIWWSYIDEYLIDRDFGSWHTELDFSQGSTSVTGMGKPDIYHPINAVLLPLIPMTSSFIRAAM